MRRQRAQDDEDGLEDYFGCEGVLGGGSEWSEWQR